MSAVAVIPRTSWQDPAKPVKGPPREAPFRQGVVHWEGIERDQTPTDIAAHLRQMQAAYLSSRGYSLGYGYGVVSDARHRMDGTLWEIRGRTINMASNPGRKWNAEKRLPAGNANDWTGSVLLIGPSGVHVSDKAAATVRALFADWHREAGTPLAPPFPHSTLDYTACCGPAYQADLAAGAFTPAPLVAAPLTPPAPIPGVIVTTTQTDWQQARVADVTFHGDQLIHVPQAAGRKAVTVNLHVVLPDHAGFVTAFLGPQPGVSTVNYTAGQVSDGTTTVPVDPDGWFALNSTGAVRVLVDLVGVHS